MTTFPVPSGWTKQWLREEKKYSPSPNCPTIVSRGAEESCTSGSSAAVHGQDGLVRQVDAADAGAFEHEFCQTLPVVGRTKRRHGDEDVVAARVDAVAAQVLALRGHLALVGPAGKETLIGLRAVVVAQVVERRRRVPMIRVRFCWAPGFFLSLYQSVALP